MLRKIIQHEFLQWRRDKRLNWLLIALLLLGATALAVQVNEEHHLLQSRRHAQESSRIAWLKQGDKHPHMAAHFGNYAFKQPEALQCFDPGLTPYTGTSVYLEPHRQNDFLFSQSQETDTGARFGTLSPALVCQFIIPLFIILLTFNSINGEKARGTYTLLLTQGLSYRQLLLGKLTAIMILFGMIFTVYLAASIAIPLLIFGREQQLPLISFLYLWVIYLTYYAIWSIAGIVVSAMTKHTGSAIALLLTLWIITNIIIPKAAANIAENRFPLNTNYGFKKKVVEDIRNGLNGHDPSSQRALRLRDSLLHAYEADSVQQLPFNFEGFVMQQGEEYSSKVYDYHFNNIFTTLKQQRNLQSWLSLTSPFIMIRHLSMAGCNSGIEPEIDFQQQAEHYRRHFVQKMNEDMMHNSTYGDWDHYKVKEADYTALEDFKASDKPLQWRLAFLVKENSFLFLWFAASVTLLLWISRRQPAI